MNAYREVMYIRTDSRERRFHLPSPVARQLSDDIRYVSNGECFRGQQVECVFDEDTVASYPIWLLPWNRPAKRRRPVKMWNRKEGYMVPR